MEVQPNCIYIIPPNRDMAILHGALHLIEPAAPRGQRLPIDFLFRSLAQDQQERSICIVLSGTGTDGTLGLKAIKGEAGMAMAQTPESAKYDGMPRSAINTGMVDYVLPPAKLPEQLVAYVEHAFAPGMRKAAGPMPRDEDERRKVFILLRDQTGHDFSQYKDNTIIRRIERRMTVNRITQLNHYIHYLQQNPMEVETLFKDLLIGVTSFFRDPEAFESLKSKVIPALFDGKPREQPVRIWVPGCSTGEEAYSIAILVQEYMRVHRLDCNVQIFATDIDSDAVETARIGKYPDGIAGDIPQQHLQRCFTREDNNYQVNKSLRDMLVFAVQSVIKDPPFSKLDLVSCRNLLIYMGAELQKKVLPLFYYSLKKGGFLFLGPSEATNAEGLVDYLNLVAVALTGWSLDEARGLLLNTVFQLINEQSREPVLNSIARFLKEGRIPGLSDHGILINRRGQEYGIRIPLAKICFEITETAAIANIAQASRFIKILQRQGCRFALDDFGSGLCSFGYLRSLPVDFLKIDGAFVKAIVEDSINLSIVRSINEIAQVMDKQTIAEFVENEAILKKLREVNINFAQGYGIGQPKPIEEMS